ncbi:MAG: outer membrane protein assembly factor BamA [Gammaproteobacteria bacterium]|jgi:outer membrane protein insertion porin family|nr:outer membrane protein assembly factor BamA [Gammaproteobacteria bacterium]
MVQRVIFSLALLFLSFTSSAFEPFVIEDIRVEGLQRISAGTIFNYLPLKVGDKLDSHRSAAAVKALYKTGFFKDVRLEQEGHLLLVSVVERPAIADISIEGNKVIKTEELRQGLKRVGLSEGEVLDRALLDKVEAELRRQYLGMGRYGVEIETTVTPLERNRSALRIQVTEGESARIQQITLIGNQAFEAEQLRDLFQLNTGNWLSFFTKSDRYSREKLTGDLETLRSWYLDRGYIHFEVTSAQVSITPNRQGIYVTINMDEGKQFILGDVALKGKMVVPEAELQEKVTLKEGEIFSRKEIAVINEALSDHLGEAGYAFANINVIPEVNEDKQIVDLIFLVDPGNRVYVNRVNITGNTKTQDLVVRREMRQYEGSRYSNREIERSQTRLRKLGYFEDVTVETLPVAGTTDQVDLNYQIEEKSTGSMMLGLGYSQTSGIVFNTNLKQDNFMGSGKQVDFEFNNSDTETAYGLGYRDPYFTEDGVSLGVGAHYRELDNSDEVTSYSYDSLAANFDVGLPTSEYERLFIGFEPQRLSNVNCGSSGVTSLCTTLIAQEGGDSFDVMELTTSWSRDSRNRAIFPDQGGYQQFRAEMGAPGGVEYYMVGYRHDLFFPLTESYTLLLKGEVGMGDGYGDQSKLPFFSRYYAGGESSVRGFAGNSIGPQDVGTGKSVGGNLKGVANAEIILPVPFLEDVKLTRISGFVDMGSVADSTSDLSGYLRASAGLSAKWLSPIGPLSFSWAKPLKEKSGDDLEAFQFRLGQMF